MIYIQKAILCMKGTEQTQKLQEKGKRKETKENQATD